MSTDPDPAAVLDDAIARIEALAKSAAKKNDKKKPRRPTRFDARDVLCALGELVIEDRESEAVERAPRLDAALAPFRESWQRAVTEELELACSEHIRGVDPRFLDHPRYDFGYTVEARRRLEMRLIAAERLGIAVDEALLADVVAADERLAPYLADDA